MIVTSQATECSVNTITATLTTIIFVNTKTADYYYTQTINT